MASLLDQKKKKTLAWVGRVVGASPTDNIDTLIVQNKKGEKCTVKLADFKATGQYRAGAGEDKRKTIGQLCSQGQNPLGVGGVVLVQKATQVGGVYFPEYLTVLKSMNGDQEKSFVEVMARVNPPKIVNKFKNGVQVQTVQGNIDVVNNKNAVVVKHPEELLMSCLNFAEKPSHMALHTRRNAIQIRDPYNDKELFIALPVRVKEGNGYRPFNKEDAEKVLSEHEGFSAILSAWRENQDSAKALEVVPGYRLTSTERLASSSSYKNLCNYYYHKHPNKGSTPALEYPGVAHFTKTIVRIAPAEYPDGRYYHVLSVSPMAANDLNLTGRDLTDDQLATLYGEQGVRGAIEPKIENTSGQTATLDDLPSLTQAAKEAAKHTLGLMPEKAQSEGWQPSVSRIEPPTEDQEGTEPTTEAPVNTKETSFGLGDLSEAPAVLINAVLGAKALPQGHENKIDDQQGGSEASKDDFSFSVAFAGAITETNKHLAKSADELSGNEPTDNALESLKGVIDVVKSVKSVKEEAALNVIENEVQSGALMQQGLFEAEDQPDNHEKDNSTDLELS